MAEENSPNPAETPSVTPSPQAKKETVRISLPSKPSAASTVKLSAPRPGQAKPGAAAVGAAAASSKAAAAAPSSAAPMASGSPAPRPARAARVAAVSPIDKVLAVAAALTAILAVARMYMLGS